MLFAKWIIFMVATDLIWSLQLRNVAIYTERSMQIMDLEIRKDITERMAHTSYDSYHQETNATYSSWLTNDITSINELGYDVLAMVIQQFFNLVFGILVLFQYHFSLLFTVTFFMIWMFLVPRLFTKKLNERSVKVTKKNEKLMKAVQPIFDKFKELAVTNKEADQLQPFTTSLTVEKLAFAYPDRSELFKNKSFQLKKGKKYALVGPSGVRKSTLLNILAGKTDHYAGSIQLDGRDSHDFSKYTS